MPLHLDLHTWPVVLITHVGEVSDLEVDTQLAEADAIFARRERHAIVFDSRHAGKVSPYMRDRTKAWLGAHEEQMRQFTVGNAFVFSSPALRFLLSTMLLFSRHRVPHKVCSSLDEATRWAVQQLAMARARVVA
jgi:hypothetical protein